MVVLEVTVDELVMEMVMDVDVAVEESVVLVLLSLIPTHFISFHIISYHFISFHIISYHFNAIRCKGWP